MPSPRLTTVFDKTRPDSAGNATIRKTVPQSYKVERYTEEDVSQPHRLARLLTKLHQNVTLATLPARQDPNTQPVMFYGFATGAAGAKLVLKHNLGRPALWAVVGWRGAGVVAAPILVSDELDATGKLTTINTLALRSYVAGVVDLRVWGL